MKFSYYALGCKVNQCEVRTMAALLETYGFEAVPFGEPADLCIINTCCVTGEGEAKSRRTVARARRACPDGVLVVTGCSAQQDSKALSSADLVVPNAQKEHCVEWIVDLFRRRGVFLTANGEPTLWGEDRTRAVVKVQDGCRSFCSYCIIPYVRGDLRSRPLSEALSEVKTLAKQGFREVVLVGIHLTCYGKERSGSPQLIDLLEAVDAVEGIERVRISSIEPGYLNEAVVERLSRLKKFCPHFHLSLQSGCDATLKRMNRPYTSRQYFEEVSRLRRAFPDMALTTDVMTGFPGETEEEFAQSVAFLEKCAFAKVHVFPYSERPGTRAAEMEQIPVPLRHERCRKLIALAEDWQKKFWTSQLGRVWPVLLEREKKGKIGGYTPNYIPVSLPAAAGKANEIVSVRLTRVTEQGMEGEVC